MDRVKLKSTKNVSWRSHPPDCEPDTKAEWVVSAVLGENLILTQGMVVIAVPTSDVQLSRKYDPNWIDDQLNKIIGRKNG